MTVATAGYKVLNADAHDVRRYSRSQVLREAGYLVEEAATGAEAIQMVRDESPDVVLLDVDLPDTDGLEICRRIKCNPKTSSILVLHVSAVVTERTRGLDNGADGYMAEPVDPAELVASVNALIRLKRAESALKVAAQEWRVTVDAIHEAVCLLDADGVIRRINRPMCAVFGRQMDDLIGTRCRELLGSGGAALDRTLGERVFQSVSLEIGDRIYEAGFNPVGRDRADNLGAVCTFRDVTDLVNSQREREETLEREIKLRCEAESANQVKDQFLAAVSHDLRGPLQAMLIWTKLLKESNQDDAGRIRTVASLERSVQAQARLIEDLLDLSAIVSGRMSLEVCLCDLRLVVSAAVETVQPAAETRQIAINVDMAAGRTVVMGDAGRLQQVLWNVLFNAVKFSPKGAPIDIRVRNDAGTVEVLVIDHGDGMDRGLLPYIFEPFRQGEKKAGRGGGLGLGLSIAKRLVEMHGGTLTADSPGTGQGSTFTMTLPLRSEPSRPAPDASSPA